MNKTNQSALLGLPIGMKVCLGSMLIKSKPKFVETKKDNLKVIKVKKEITE